MDATTRIPIEHAGEYMKAIAEGVKSARVDRLRETLPMEDFQTVMTLALVALVAVSEAAREFKEPRSRIMDEAFAVANELWTAARDSAGELGLTDEGDKAGTA